MPITRSAEKALRQSKRRRARNVAQKDALKTLVKSYRKAVETKKKDEAKKLLPKLYAVLDKAAKRGKILKKNTASRLKSRLTKAFVKLG